MLPEIEAGYIDSRSVSRPNTHGKLKLNEAAQQAAEITSTPYKNILGSVKEKTQKHTDGKGRKGEKTQNNHSTKKNGPKEDRPLNLKIDGIAKYAK
ncbi:hypothetical protein JTB14_012569 [Gonioctena quinquepunctata]|nr:hypothetical protein JTB14_012569 [Gonioctena quinquepunctata]